MMSVRFLFLISFWKIVIQFGSEKSVAVILSFTQAIGIVARTVIFRGI
jgi:hypothetical protein